MINCFGRVFFIYLTLVKNVMNCPFSLLSVNTTPVFQMPNVIFTQLICQDFSRVIQNTVYGGMVNKFIYNLAVQISQVPKWRYICFSSGNCWNVRQCTFCVLQLKPTLLPLSYIPIFCLPLLSRLSKKRKNVQMICYPILSDIILQT